MGVLSRSLLVTLGWALVQGQIQFSILITEGRGVHPIWFLAVFLLTVEASLLLEEMEQTLRCWLSSLLLSVAMVFVLLSLPTLLGALTMEFVSIIILGSVQTVASVVIISAPIGLLGCFVGQMVRNRLL